MIGSPDDNVLPPFETTDADFTEIDTNTEVAVEDESLLMNSPLIEELSESHVGSWNRLVSQTNWEKGAVILQWREAMTEAGLPKAACSDEAWSRRVGNVTPQHVGRLRRVAERFGGKATDYSTLYWSHFQAALDWDDAELWLEGALQNGWSVAQMKVQRWEAVGAPDELKPRAEDIFTAELDEDVNPYLDSNSDAGRRTADRAEIRAAEIGGADMVEGFDPDSPPFEADESDGGKKEPKKSKNKASEAPGGPTTSDLLVTLTDFSGFPEDLADAMDLLKVAILNHKLAGWKDVSAQKLTSRLEALTALVVSVEG